MSEIIRLHGSVVEAIFVSEGNDPSDFEPRELPSGYEQYKGWTAMGSEDTGEYDSGKSAMVNFEIDLYDENYEYRGTAIGGYYVQGDYSFDFGSDHFYDFEIAEETPESKFNDFLIELAEDEDLSIKQKINKINKYKY